ncbi:hypothetical protein TNCV_3054791 [Trichonephila clavipes]|nr:hypothetical protein TNCV_3054791 [Trichonephila clavipes]
MNRHMELVYPSSMNDYGPYRVKRSYLNTRSSLVPWEPSVTVIHERLWTMQVKRSSHVTWFVADVTCSVKESRMWRMKVKKEPSVSVIHERLRTMQDKEVMSRPMVCRSCYVLSEGRQSVEDEGQKVSAPPHPQMKIILQIVREFLAMCVGH